MNHVSPKISKEYLTELIQASRQQRGGKAAKYLSLETYRDTIVELMEHDIQLSLILRWLKEEHGVVLVPNTLRKYITKKIGRDVYDEYLDRNGWLKRRRLLVPTEAKKAHPGSMPTLPEPKKADTEPMPPQRKKTVTAAEMKEGLRSNSIDPSEFD